MEIPRYILEVGVGNGGNHLEREQVGENTLYYVNDTNLAHLDDVQIRYPWVTGVPGSAEDLDFPAGFFDLIEVRFPFRKLLVPGLQQRARNLYDLGSELQAWCPDDLESPQWYGRFTHILRPEGKMVIWGDEFVDLDQIANLSAPHFTIHSIIPLSVDDLIDMGTETSLHAANALSWDIKRGKVKETPKKITLIKTTA